MKHIRKSANATQNLIFKYTVFMSSVVVLCPSNAGLDSVEGPPFYVVIRVKYN